MVSVNTDQPTKKTTKGKQKIEIKKIEMKSSRQVTFSKRRKGLFQKCSELSKFGSEYAVVTFSVAGKPIVDGYPSPDSVIRRFRNDAEASKTDEGTSCLSTNGCHSYWWENPIDNLGLEGLEKFKIALEGLRKQVLSRVGQINSSDDTETDDLGCIIDASDDVNLPDNYQEITESINLEKSEEFPVTLEGSNDTEIVDLGCVIDASDDVYVPDVSQEITGSLNLEGHKKLQMILEDFTKEIERSNDTKTNDLVCTIDATDDLYLPDLSQEITESMNFEEPERFPITHEGSNDPESVDLGYTNACYGVQVAELSQEKMERFDFGWMEKILGGQVSDYFEWMDHTVSEIYPELLPIDNGSHSSFDMIGSCEY